MPERDGCTHRPTLETKSLCGLTQDLRMEIHQECSNRVLVRFTNSCPERMFPLYNLVPLCFSAWARLSMQAMGKEPSYSFCLQNSRLSFNSYKYCARYSSFICIYIGAIARLSFTVGIPMRLLFFGPDSRLNCHMQIAKESSWQNWVKFCEPTQNISSRGNANRYRLRYLREWSASDCSNRVSILTAFHNPS